MAGRAKKLRNWLRGERVLVVLIVCQLAFLLVQVGLWHWRTGEATLTAEHGIHAEGQDGQETAEGIVGTSADPAESIHFAITRKMTLRAGMYRAAAHYSAGPGASGEFRIYASLMCYNGPVAMPGGQTQSEMIFWLPQRIDDFQLEFLAAGGQLTLRSVDVTPLNNNAVLLQQLFWFAAIDLLWLLFRRRLPGLTGRRAAVAFTVAAITLFASAPAFTARLVGIDDLLFHLNRVEGLAQELLAGTPLPVYMQTNWFEGYGYPVSVFYCDLFLYLPACLRVIGFPLQTAVQVYIVCVNLVTAAAAAWAFRHIFRSDAAGLLGCALYMLAPYRLYDVYVRSALGEYTAMAFAPLILAGLWDLFTVDPASPRYRRAWVPVAAGYAGVLQSHLLSAEMYALLTLGLCVCLLRRTLRPATFTALCKAVGAVVMAALWFLVPLLDCLRRGGLEISETAVRKPQLEGAHLGQLLEIFVSAENRISLNAMADNRGEMPQTVGAALLAGLFLFLLYILLHAPEKTDRNWQAGRAALWAGGAALVLCLWTTPWDLLENIPVLGRILSSVQFPWRFLGAATLLLTMAACALAELLRSRPQMRMLLLGALTLLCVLEGGQTISTAMSTWSLSPYWELRASDTYNSMGGEYLPAGMHGDGALRGYAKVPESETAVVESYTHADGAYILRAGAPQGGTVALPLLWYPYYRAVQDDGAELAVTQNAQWKAEITLPPGFAGTVRIWFDPPWYWRVSALASLLFIAGGGVWAVVRRKKSDLQPAANRL